MISNFFSLFGGTTGVVCIVWWVVKFGNANDIVVITTVQAIISFFFTPLLSPFGDRLKKSDVLLYCGIIISLKSFALALLAQFGVFNLPVICVLQVIGTICMAIILPVRQTIVTELVESSKLSQAIPGYRIAERP